MVDFIGKERYGFEDVVALVQYLRSDDGCEWDRAQTHESIRRNFIEETYEACEAMDDPVHLKEELGDVLLQVVFHAGLEQDAGHFSVDDVCNGICKKLIKRHPHLFCGGERQDWETMKRTQRGNQTVSEAMAGVSKALPATWRADKIQSKAEKSGFRWNDISQSVAKLEEELHELKDALHGSGDPTKELGDLLFAAVNVARWLGTDPEDALNAASTKFTGRFSKVEEAVAREGRQLSDLTEEELLVYWEQAKAVSRENEDETGKN